MCIRDSVGPFAYIRPNCHVGKEVKVGDFVELKNSNIDDGTKISHLTYILSLIHIYKFNQVVKVSLDNLFSQIDEGNMKELDVIIKADVQGSVCLLYTSRCV